MKNRVEAGRQAKFAGDDFEEWLNTQHEKAKHLGILAHVEKTQAVTRMVHGRLIYAERGVADYIGCFESGRYLALEAKSTKDKRFAKSNVSVKQQDHLERVARAGGLALLLVEFREIYLGYLLRRCFAIPWLEVPWAVKRTAESISADELLGREALPDCYLKQWHAGGVSSTVVRTRRYARE